MKTPPMTLIIFGLLVILSLFTLPGRGSDINDIGGNPSPGYPSPTSPHDPIILSWIEDNRVISLWTAPTQQSIVLYDSWEFILFGSVNSTWTITMNEKKILNGTIPGSGYSNISFIPQGYSSARIRILIGNITYSWSHIIIKNKSIGYNPPELGGSGGFTESDIKKARQKTAISIIISGGILSSPLVYFSMKAWINKRGMKQI